MRNSRWERENGGFVKRKSGVEIAVIERLCNISQLVDCPVASDERVPLPKSSIVF